MSKTSRALAAKYGTENPQAVIDALEPAPQSGGDITNRIIQIEGEGKNPQSQLSASVSSRVIRGST